MKALKNFSLKLLGLMWVLSFNLQAQADISANYQQRLSECYSTGLGGLDCEKFVNESFAKEAIEKEGGMNILGLPSGGQVQSGTDDCKLDANGDWVCGQAQMRPPGAANKIIQPTPADPGTGTTPPTEALRAAAAENPLVQQCDTAMSAADQCCNNPEKCFGSKPSTGEGSATDGLLFGGTQAALAIASSMPTSSWSQMCKNMKISGGSMAAINTYLGAQCSNYASKCNTSCGAAAKAQLNKRIDCEQIPATDTNGRAACLTKNREIASVAENLNGYAESCRIYSNRSTAMFSQASSSGLGAALAAKCEDDTVTEPTTDEQMFANPSCGNAAAASNPICRELCSRAGAEVNPKCYGYPGLNSGNYGLGSNNGNPDNPNGLNRFSGSVPDDEEGSQNPNFSDVAAATKGINAGNGGGGGAGLGSSGDSGGGAGRGGAGGTADGYNTKIDRGLSSGGGYSSTGGRLQTGTSGGFSGYGGTGAVTDQGRKFNLKDFLPDKGQNTKLAARLPQSIVAEIGPAHANIFQKITNRFYQVCTRDALYDCSSLKRSKLGN